ncbi:MAG: 5'/3'-nucleotidase SurE [Anaerolineales bacterium]
MARAYKPQILLTNDDGIGSAGLWAAAEALAELGFVTVAAPREQHSGAGRSMPHASDGVLREEQVTIHGKTWTVYAVGGSPAQTVQHAILELMPRRPDLVVAGINHGENLTTSITISGTVGAALEAAAFGVPALAVSLEMPKEKQRGESDADFSAAAHYTARFGRLLLEADGLPDVDVLKIDVPSDATPETPWRVTRLSRSQYYVPVSPGRQHLTEPVRVDYEIRFDQDLLEPDSDVFVVRVAREVSVTPLSLDMTSRVDLGELGRRLGAPGAPA